MLFVPYSNKFFRLLAKLVSAQIYRIVCTQIFGIICVCSRKTDDGYYSDILLHASTIIVFVDGEEQPRPKRRIFAGYYKRFDGMPFYVVDVVRDLETRREIVTNLWHNLCM